MSPSSGPRLNGSITRAVLRAFRDDPDGRRLVEQAKAEKKKSKSKSKRPKGKR